MSSWSLSSNVVKRNVAAHTAISQDSGKRNMKVESSGSQSCCSVTIDIKNHLVAPAVSTDDHPVIQEDAHRRLSEEEQQAMDLATEGRTRNIQNQTLNLAILILEEWSILFEENTHTDSSLLLPKKFSCSTCEESQRRRLRPVAARVLHEPGTCLQVDQFEWMHPVLGTVMVWRKTAEGCRSTWNETACVWNLMCWSVRRDLDTWRREQLLRMRSWMVCTSMSLTHPRVPTQLWNHRRKRERACIENVVEHQITFQVAWTGSPDSRDQGRALSTAVRIWTDCSQEEGRWVSGNEEEGVGGGYRTGDTKPPWSNSTELRVMGRGKDDPHLRSDLREKGEQLPVIAFDFAFVKTTVELSTRFSWRSFPFWERRPLTVLPLDWSNSLRVSSTRTCGLWQTRWKTWRAIWWISRRQASNPAERHSSEIFGADKPIWAWLLCRQANQSGTTATRCSSRVFGSTGGRVFSRTIRRLEPSRPHDAGFLGKVKVSRGTHRTVLCGVDRERNLHHHPFWLERNTQSHNPDLPDKNETFSKTSTDTTTRMMLTIWSTTAFEIWWWGVWDDSRSQETHGNCQAGWRSLVSRLRGRKCDSCQILEMAAPQLSRWKNWLKTTGRTSLASPEMDMINTEAALDCLLENEVVRKHLTTRCEKTWRKRQWVGVQSSLRGTWIQMARVPGRPVCPGSFVEAAETIAGSTPSWSTMGWSISHVRLWTNWVHEMRERTTGQTHT